MRTFTRFVTLPKSLRAIPAASQPAGPEENAQEIRATVVMASRATPAERRAAVRRLAKQFPHQRRYVSPEEFEARFGPEPRDLQRVADYARDNGLRVIEISPARRAVVLTGAAAAFQKAFDTRFVRCPAAGRVYRSYEGGIRVPAFLAGAVEGILGFDENYMAVHHAGAAPAAAPEFVDPSVIARRYEFPEGVQGRGQCIAILNFAGGFHRSDLRNYFERRGLKMPSLRVVERAGQKNNPAEPEAVRKLMQALGAGPEPAMIVRLAKIRMAEEAGAAVDAQIAAALSTVEATMDICLAGAFANRAKLVSIFAPNTEQGFFEAFTTALAGNGFRPTVISCSWGSCEETYDDSILQILENVFQDAALRGVTICVSSGDRGADQDAKGKPRVHFPASSPHVLACGGTHLHDLGEKFEETTWDELIATHRMSTGGGFSNFFAIPAWQKKHVTASSRQTHRGVPDVAGRACIREGYEVIVDKFRIPMGGTSAAAPMWAGLVARVNELLGRPAGLLGPLLYRSNFRHALRAIDTGSNGFYDAGPGWNPCTGLGSPRGIVLVEVLRTVSAAAPPKAKKTRHRRRKLRAR